jgi:hypothetical protein
MKNILCIVFLAGTLAARAQAPANDLLRHIPADADQVIDINLGTLSSKIDIPGIFALLGNKSKNAKAMTMINDLLSGGLDFHQHMILVPANNPTAADSNKYFTVILHITDSAKFVAALRSMAKESDVPTLHFVHLAGKERVATYKSNAVAWTDKVAVFTTYTSLASKKGAEELASARLKAARHTAAMLTGYSNTKFITDEHFTTAFSDDGDVHIWSHKNTLASFANKFSKLAPNMAQLEMLSQMAGQNKGKNESIATVRFDNGRISYSTLKFMTPDQIAATQRALGQGLNPELLAIVPPRPLLGVVGLHIDMGVMEDTLKKIPSFAMIDTMMVGKGVHIMDIVHALKGDFLLLVCNPDKPAATDSAGKPKMPSPPLYLVASITSKDAFAKIGPMIKLKDALTPDADTATTDTAHSKNPFPYYLTQNDLVVFGKRRRLTGFFTPGTGVEPVGNLLLQADTRTSALNAVLDFHALADDLLGPTLNTPDASSKDKAVLDLLHNLQTLQISVGAIRGDAMETRVELNFTDKSKNSLTTLMNMVSSLSGSH